MWQQRRSLTMHPVNLPDGASAKRVALLVGGGSAPFRQKGAWLETAVPEVLAHEVVAIDL